ncbi:tetratricopeptide repeat protein [Aliikangiella marina]|uniref:Tetratricopeptide repeat protein n=1 Tax=Aliikangiella marina TaxID=1712262 RepID=A0A545TIP4_9GAMM|nr:tetratricopeptide repeat protein [Aliikangiella marina]TQV77078.1 tetratricopeptide repeat protein [Aliikangiella marina]
MKWFSDPMTLPKLNKTLKLNLLVIGTLITVGCASVDKQSLPEPIEADQEQTDPTAVAQDGGQPGQTVSSLPMVEDPMKVDLPLELIKAYDEAKSLFAAKNIEGAINKLKQTQQAFPQESGPSYRIARIYLQEKQYEKALEAVESSVFVNPKNYYAQNLKGVILREMGKFEEAKTAYLASLEAYPRHAQTHLNLGILADIYQYDLALALKHYQYYLELIQSEDKKVSGWVIDLKRRIPQGN